MHQEHFFRNAISWLHINILLCLCHHFLQPSPTERYLSCFQELLLMIGSWASWSSYLCPWARDRDSWMGNGWSKVILHFISFFLFYTIHRVRCITVSSVHLICRDVSLSSHPDQSIEHFQHPENVPVCALLTQTPTLEVRKDQSFDREVPVYFPQQCPRLSISLQLLQHWVLLIFVFFASLIELVGPFDRSEVSVLFCFFLSGNTLSFRNSSSVNYLFTSFAYWLQSIMNSFLWPQGVWDWSEPLPSPPVRHPLLSYRSCVVYGIQGHLLSQPMNSKPCSSFCQAGPPWTFLYTYFLTLTLSCLRFISVSIECQLHANNDAKSFMCIVSSLPCWALVLWFCLTALGLGCCVQALPSCGLWASHCAGFSRCAAWAPGRAGISRCGSGALQLRFSSCGAWA